MKKLLLSTLISALVFSSFLGVYADGKTNVAVDESVIVSDVKSHVEYFLENGYSGFYDVSQMSSDVIAFTSHNNNFEIVIHTQFNMTLKAENPTELPAIKGILDAAGIETATVKSRLSQRAPLSDAMLSDVAEANPKLTDTQAMAAAGLMADQIANVQQYIGEPQDIHFYFKVKGSINNEDVVITEMLLDDGAGGYVNAEQALPESDRSIYNEYKADFWNEAAKKENALQNESKSAETETRGATQGQLDARDYARTWVYPGKVAICDCGKRDCTGMTHSASYNNSQYPTYYLHNDCANFASQAVAAGGIPKTSTWKPGKHAWMTARGLESYFKDRGLLDNRGYTWASAGGLAFCKSSAGADAYHVEVIVLNDTVTRQFCAHTHDRYNTKLLDDENWSYYNVIYE